MPKKLAVLFLVTAVYRCRQNERFENLALSKTRPCQKLGPVKTLTVRENVCVARNTVTSISNHIIESQWRFGPKLVFYTINRYY